MVSALGNHPALGAWEIINEPEGSVLNNQVNTNKCYDTTPLATTGAGFGKNYVPMQKYISPFSRALQVNFKIFFLKIAF